MRQIEVTLNNRKMTTWTDEHPKLKPGNFVSFKGNTEDLWKIDKVYETSIDKNDIKRNWHVGGL